MTGMDANLLDVIHKSCGAIAFRVRCTAEEWRGGGVILDSYTIVYDDGRVLVDDDGSGVVGSILCCQSCGQGIICQTALVGDQVMAYSELEA